MFNGYTKTVKHRKPLPAKRNRKPPTKRQDKDAIARFYEAFPHLKPKG